MYRLIYQVKENFNIKWVFITILFLSTLGFYANNFTPSTIWHVSVFIILTGAVTYSLSQILINNVRRSCLLCFGFMIYLILRLLGLTQLIYIILLISSLLALESLLK